MNLRDYIGDTRTDSLPPGFLKSIKIKLRHEESHIFPRQKSSEGAGRTSRENDGLEIGKNENRLAPSFMTYRVPSRLLAKKGTLPLPDHKKQNNEPLNDFVSISRQSTAPVLRSHKYKPNCKYNLELPLKPERKLKTAKIRQHGTAHKPDLVFLPDEFIPEKDTKDNTQQGDSVQVNIGTESDLSCPEKSSTENAFIERKLSSKDSTRNEKRTTTDVDNSEQALPHLPSQPQQKLNTTAKDENNHDTLPELKIEKREASAVNKTRGSKRMEEINVWMTNATKKERKVAFDLLSSFIENEKIKSSKPKRDRILIALEALERRKTPAFLPSKKDSSRKMAIIDLNMKESNGAPLTPHFMKGEHQKTWHRLPQYSYSNVKNNGAMFVQPAKVYDRHFTIHPEWGLHKTIGSMVIKT